MRRNGALRATLVGALACSAPFMAAASDHNEPAPDAVWPAESALHKEWDISDLFAWVDRDQDKLNIIVAWHPQQLPLEEDERAEYNDQVLFRIHVRYERKGAQVFSDRYLDREITFRYGQNAQGEWGMLVQGLPGTEPVVLDCDSDLGWVGYDLEVGSGRPVDADPQETIQVATGIWDDPFVFDVDGYNASLTRALNGEVGLQFDPQRDTFEGHNASAFVLSVPIEALEDNWEGFDRSGFLSTEKVHIWTTTWITEAEAAREGRE